jgi:hypothetical protein
VDLGERKDEVIVEVVVSGATCYDEVKTRLDAMKQQTELVWMSARSPGSERSEVIVASDAHCRGGLVDEREIEGPAAESPWERATEDEGNKIDEIGSE